MKIHKDDILESALNSGIAFTANKYNISKEEVLEVVRWFKKDVDYNVPCECEVMKSKGFCLISCMNCAKGHNERINI